MPRYLTALPVYNEGRHVNGVLDEVVKHAAGDVLAIDDGSSDNTAEVLAQRSDIRVVRHAVNKGYGAALLTAFDYAVLKGYDVLVTIDSDGQHDSSLMPQFFAAAEHAHIVSGSRYLQVFDGNSLPPPERQNVNRIVTEELNQRFGLKLTDAFCGFKAYRVCALKRLNILETGYAMPLEVWAKAATAGMRIVEIPVPLVYLDEKRTFGGNLDDAQVRLEYYRLTIERAATEAETAGDYLSGCGERA